MAAVEISVVVPAYDEAPNLERLLVEVRAALDTTGRSWELVVVDDGSGDATPSILDALCAAESRLRAVRLPERSGQTRALEAGFRSARGTFIATCDADVQCPPAEIPTLFQLLQDTQADLACGIRAHRRDPASRRLASSVANHLRRWAIAPEVRDLACPLRVFRASTLESLSRKIPLFDGAHRWLPALFVLGGLRVVQREVPHRPRIAGESKYTTRARLIPILRETGLVLAVAARQRPLRRLRSIAQRFGCVAVAIGALALRT